MTSRGLAKTVDRDTFDTFLSALKRPQVLEVLDENERAASLAVASWFESIAVQGTEVYSAFEINSDEELDEPDSTRTLLKHYRNMFSSSSSFTQQQLTRNGSATLPRSRKTSGAGLPLHGGSSAQLQQLQLQLAFPQQLSPRPSASPLARNISGLISLHHITDDSQSQELQECLSKLDTWGNFDVFQVARLTGGKPLATVSLAMLHHLDLVDRLQLPVPKIKNFLKEIERGYKNNPYHNSTHAADVVQSVGSMIIADELHMKLPLLQILAVVASAIIHDVGHPGVSNDFHIRTKSKEALRYNDRSVNENLHLSHAFKLLLQPENNFLEGLSEDEYRMLRNMIIELVLGTDMATHEDVLRDCSAHVAMLGPDVAMWPDMARCNALRLLLHGADISNAARPLPLCAKWAEWVTEEFWCQGDRERHLGLTVSPLNDRERAAVPKSQLVFLKHVVEPCFEELAAVTPKAVAQVMVQLRANRQHWQEQCGDDAAAGGSSRSSSKGGSA